MDIWLSYIRYVEDDPIESKLLLLSRCVNYMTRSYKVWMIYLRLLQSSISPQSSEKAINKVAGQFERCLLHLSKFPLIWVEYIKFSHRYLHYTGITQTRVLCDRSLQELPVIQHRLIWPHFLDLADVARGSTGFGIWFRYYELTKYLPELGVKFLGEQKIGFDTVVERLVSYSGGQDLRRLNQVFANDILENSHSLVLLGKSQWQVYYEFLSLLVNRRKRKDPFLCKITENLAQNCMKKFPDQLGRVYVKLAQFYINTGDSAKAVDIFEKGIHTVMTVKDFTLIFDAYMEFEETSISKLVEAEEDGVKLDSQMARFESNLAKREFLINDILLKQDKNNVSTWLDRIKLFTKEEIKQALETYVKALTTIDPVASRDLHLLWIGYYKVYEENGDLKTARSILSTAVKVPFKNVDELVEIWIEWANLEMRHDDFDQAILLLSKATELKHKDVDFYDEKLSAQVRAPKSLKLWSFYIDLVEITEDVHKTMQVYEQTVDLKLATPLIIINYCTFLEEHSRFEQCFSVFDRAVNLFTYPVVFEIWNIYLSKAVQLQKPMGLSVERVRDLFDRALEECPARLSKPIYMLYANFEEGEGSISKSLKLYTDAMAKLLSALEPDRLSDQVKQILDVVRIQVVKCKQYSGSSSARTAFEFAIDKVPNTAEKGDLFTDFAQLEVDLGEITRARLILEHAATSLIPIDPSLERVWDFWKSVEVAHGNEETFKAMLRFRRRVETENDLKREKLLQARVETDVIGFVKSKSEKNPDAIELDIDSE